MEALYNNNGREKEEGNDDELIICFSNSFSSGFFLRFEVDKVMAKPWPGCSGEHKACKEWPSK